MITANDVFEGFVWCAMIFAMFQVGRYTRRSFSDEEIRPVGFTNEERQREQELLAALRACDQINPDACWVIIQGKMKDNDVVGVFAGSNFFPDEAIASACDWAAQVVRSRKPDRDGPDKLG